MKLFRRVAQVQVGPRIVSDLRCVFHVERTMRRNPNQVSVKVYNLSESTRAEIEASRQQAITGATDGLGHPLKRVFVSLTVGYEDQTFRTFHGDVRRIVTRSEPPDVVTEVFGGDGEVATFYGRVNQHFARGTSVGSILLYLANNMGVGVGNSIEMFRNAHLRDLRNYQDGTVLSGSPTTELDHLCTAAGLEWSIQDDALQVVPLGGSLGDSGMDIGPDTGMIGSPTKDPVTRVIKAKCLIQPNIVPGRRVRIRSAFVNQVIRVNKTVMSGDTHGEDWYIELEGRAPSAPLFRR